MGRAVAAAAGSCAPFEGVVCRVVAPRFATAAHLLSGEGASLVGGRWNPPGVRAAYCSLDERTALAECAARATGLGLAGVRTYEWRSVGLHVWLERVLDVESSGLLRALGVAVDSVLAEDHRGARETLGQCIGRRSVGAGVQALLVPSAARREGRNLVLFPDRVGSDAVALPAGLGP